MFSYFNYILNGTAWESPADRDSVVGFARGFRTTPTNQHRRQSNSVLLFLCVLQDKTNPLRVMDGIDRVPDSPRGSSRPVEVDASSSSLSSAPNSGNHISLSSVFKDLSVDKEEQAHWVDVCRAYRQYAQFAVKQFGLNHPTRLADLPAPQQAVLPKHLQIGSPEFQEQTHHFKDAAIRNQFALDCILRHAGQPHSQQQQDTHFATDTQFGKVSSVLKSLARDWSSEGERERSMAYTPILGALDTYVPLQKGTVQKVCVPGAGVGRIACEIAGKGYVVQGNEFSLYMLLASDYILNGPLGSGLHISPWLLETRNVVSAKDQLRKVLIPDIDPSTLASNGKEDSEFSMAAGDFASIYSAESESKAWDCVVACFFLDAVPNVVQYLQVVYHMLKPNGVLINLGPLHWHWSGPSMGLEDNAIEDYETRWKHLDSRYMTSIDLTWEDIKQVMLNIGFELVKESRAPAVYTADSRSLLNTEYRCVHFVARKPATETTKKVRCRLHRSHTRPTHTNCSLPSE